MSELFSEISAVQSLLLSKMVISQYVNLIITNDNIDIIETHTHIIGSSIYSQYKKNFILFIYSIYPHFYLKNQGLSHNQQLILHFY